MRVELPELDADGTDPKARQVNNLAANSAYRPSAIKKKLGKTHVLPSPSQYLDQR